MKKKHLLTSLSVLALSGSLNANGVMAQGDEIMEEVITTGTRTAGRTATESTAPVDVVSAQDFVNQGDTDLSTLLRNVVPSYNVNTQPISDAATIVRPANLRGLAPDHTLVLVNGKRRHRAAVIYWLGNGVSDGAQGPDVSAIPAIALKQAEVLRDGAAAQYGSDAIAGVMNFILKDDAEGGSIEVRHGEFYEGDGTQSTVSGNIGLPFTDNGFVNLSFEYGNTDPTDRSVQSTDAAALIEAGNTAVGDPAQIWGQPSIDNEIKLLANLGLELGGGKEFYAFGNYVEKEVEGGFFYRNPDTRTGVYSNDDGITRLVGDLDPTNSITCPVVNVGDAAALALVMDNSTPVGADCFVFNEMFPGGFTPRFGGELTDFAGVMGVKGETENGLFWDVSVGIGQNDVDFFIRNTVNASLGPQSPTEFNPGAYTQLDKNFNVDLSYPLAVSWMSSDLNIAGGFEYREEQFEVTVGDQASYEVGPLSDQGFSAASNGFNGFSPISGGTFDRANFAAYVDFEGEVTENLLMSAALRWEDFEDFGTTTNGKIAANFRMTENISLRGSYSTGFRAPTPGQSNAFNVSTEFNVLASKLVNNATVPPTSLIAEKTGKAKPLDPEESTNMTFGAIFEFDEITLTVDYFKIELEDRITLSQELSLQPSDIADLVASGITGAADIQNIRFFTNDFDTETEGFDIVATTSVDWLNGSTDFSIAYNKTETTVEKYTPGVIDNIRIWELEQGLPETRWNISANHYMDNWRFLARISYYDDFYESEDERTYGDEYVVDAEVAYDVNENYTITLGAQNIFDEYPDENPNGGDFYGRKYGQYSPIGFNGGFWYLKLRYSL